MQNWRPRESERVFTTPKDVPGFNHLTRLEPVIAVHTPPAGEEKVVFVTASNRCFDYDLVSVLGTSIDYGELEMRRATPLRMEEWNRLLIAQAKSDYLLLLDWEHLISGLDNTDTEILHRAVQEIRNRHLPVDVAPVDTANKFLPVEWFYFEVSPPLWCPPMTVYLIANVENEIFAVTKEGKYVPVRRQPVEALLKAGLLTHHYQPDESLHHV